MHLLSGQRTLQLLQQVPRRPQLAHTPLLDHLLRQSLVALCLVVQTQ